MDDRQIQNELLSLLESNGAEVRKEPLGGSGGGFCSYKGKYVFFVDTNVPASETNAAAAKAVKQLVDVESIYLRPQIRDYIEEQSD